MISYLPVRSVEEGSSKRPKNSFQRTITKEIPIATKDKMSTAKAPMMRRRSIFRPRCTKKPSMRKRSLRWFQTRMMGRVRRSAMMAPFEAATTMPAMMIAATRDQAMPAARLRSTPTPESAKPIARGRHRFMNAPALAL